MDVRFSEAIRLGAMMNPQGFGKLEAVFGLFRKRRSTCALGAAFEAVPCKRIPYTDRPPQVAFRGAPTTTGIEIETPVLWGRVMWSRQKCPACMDFDVYGPVHRIIAMHLNDKHRWSRERIADWVEDIEKRLGIGISAPEAISDQMTAPVNG